MKVLSVAWTIYDNRLEVFCKNCTGGGLVIKNICEYIGMREESYLLIGRFKLPAMKLGNINIVSTDCKHNMDFDFQEKNEIHMIEMLLSFEKALDDIHPDIVNIHGIGEFALQCIDVCRKRKFPFVFTEHLYIGFQKEIEGYGQAVRWEEQLYRIPDMQIIAVSNGMKRKILHDYPLIPEKNVKVILNGTDFFVEQSGEKSSFYTKRKKTLLCAGTILVRKNQLQIVRAYQLLPQTIKRDIKIVFCGVDRMEGELQHSIGMINAEENLIYEGAVSSDEMKRQYALADGLIMPSLAEGLSIAALEAIACGLPLIMFSDSECANDLCDEKMVVLAKERSDECLADAIVKWYKTLWDKSYIVEKSQYFSLERMAEDYIKYYYERLKGVSDK